MMCFSINAGEMKTFEVTHVQQSAYSFKTKRNDAAAI